jgi:glyoxylase-like metal-dependent hydrolase (beta-lactamase superfamily II)
MKHFDLPAGVQVFERGWLSANMTLCVGESRAALVDSGYFTHADQSVALVRHALGERPLDLLVNTHLHSDHCGGNAALQRAYQAIETRIPPGQAEFVARWDADALTYAPTGQHCPPFVFDQTLVPLETVRLGHASWTVHAAPGHDPNAVLLFEPKSRTLISGDALWENGFGVVFPELEGDQAFQEVAQTLDLIEQLAPLTVIPGHGQVFRYAADHVARARQRLHAFVANPVKHAQHAAKVLLKFKLLELQRVESGVFEAWARQTPYLQLVQARFFPAVPLNEWLAQLIDDLARAGAARIDGTHIVNA